MIDNENPRDDAVEKELAGVPEDMLDKEQDGPGEETLDDALNALRGDLDKANQDVLYARAEVQNVRRRMEKDIQDARQYAATGDCHHPWVAAGRRRTLGAGPSDGRGRITTPSPARLD